MSNLLPEIRNAARALIVRDGSLLLLRKEYEDGEERYALPGGGQAPGETLIQSLQRECEEEIGVVVQVRELVYVADFFKERRTTPPSTRHLVEFLFFCSVPVDYVPTNGYHPDKHQVEVVWLELSKLHREPLYPRSLASYLKQDQVPSAPVYLGTIS